LVAVDARRQTRTASPAMRMIPRTTVVSSPPTADPRRTVRAAAAGPLPDGGGVAQQAVGQRVAQLASGLRPAASGLPAAPVGA